MLLATTAAAAFVLLVAPKRTMALVGPAAVGFIIHPLLGVAVLGGGLALVQLRSIRSSRTAALDADIDSALGVELVGLGVTAGLPFRNAAMMTADQLRGPIGDEISQALRSVAAGQQPKITSAAIRSMFSSAESSESAGMPLAGQLNAMALDRRRAAAAASRERLARLPVKMLFPLAFLILPGFVLLTVVPPLMSGLSKLSL
jgi:hypothetical protein